MQSDFDNNLLDYFTDVEHIRGAFKEYVAAPVLPKRLIVIHGVGGVGKSSLLRMFRIHCKSEKVPVALASGDDRKSVMDALTRWMDDLKEDGIKFAALGKTLESYRAIQAKVDEQAQKVQGGRGRMADIAGKAASKTAESAGGALMGAAIGSMIPGVGTAIGGALGGVLGGMGADALVDWLRGFLTKPDIDLLLDPSKRFTSDFLEDLATAAEKRRIVLMLDTFEQMSAFDDWARDVAQRIHLNVLMVIAGRKLPDWSRSWQDWMANAQVEELKPMTEDVMRQLIHRYYATMRGGAPDPAQVEAIIHFARGLPMVVTSAVQLWVKYGVEDFQSVKAEIVANLVDRLMEGVPRALIPALEAAAVVRWFDQPILRAVTGLEDVREVYNELRRFPFVRTRIEGLALHDSVREMMDENLRMQDSERHAELHKRAAVYFEKRLEKATGEEAERLGLERLYHRIRADEEAGIQLFQEMANGLASHQLFGGNLQTLINDAQNYPLRNKNNSLWISYFIGYLAYSESRWGDAERTLKSIQINKPDDKKLQAYTLSTMGMILAKWQRLGQSETMEEAIKILEQSLKIIPLDNHLIKGELNLAFIYLFQGDWGKSLHLLDQVIDFLANTNDNGGLVDAYSRKLGYFATKGDWKNMLSMQKFALDSSARFGLPIQFKVKILGASPWALIWAGKYSECERNSAEGMEFSNSRQDIAQVNWFRTNLGFSLAMQDRFSEANRYFTETMTSLLNRDQEQTTYSANAQFFWGISLMQEGKWDDAQVKLSNSLSIREGFNITPNIPELLICLARLSEVEQNLDKALLRYERCLKTGDSGRKNFGCAAITGLVRVKHAQGDYAAIPPLLGEAEQLAQQYEYNDHLTSLRLTQGHLAWGTGKKDDAISFYQHAMIYALRYNRFLLDELLSGRPQGTPLRPIIPYCVEHSDDPLKGTSGKKILLALCDWWKTGVNDIGAPRPDTISPIPEGIPLLKAEKIAREREPGDGSIQKSVLEQIEAVL